MDLIITHLKENQLILQTMLIINVQNGIQGIPKRKNFPAWEDNKDKNNFYIKAL